MSHKEIIIFILDGIIEGLIQLKNDPLFDYVSSDDILRACIERVESSKHIVEVLKYDSK